MEPKLNHYLEFITHHEVMTSEMFYQFGKRDEILVAPNQL
jgi:hypothetical protein